MRTLSSTTRSPYDMLAAAYDARATPRTKVVAKWLRRSRVLQSAARLLDLGVGTGLLWECIGSLPAGSLVVGVDRSFGMLARAQARPVGHLCVVQADFGKLPFRIARFDTVFMTFSARHAPDLARTLRSAATKLAPNGHLILVDYSADTQLQLAGMVLRCYALLNAAADTARAKMLPRTRPFFAACHEDDLIAAANRAGFTMKTRRYGQVLEADGCESVVDFVMNSPPVAFDLIHCRQRMRDAIREQLLLEYHNRLLPRRVCSRILFCVMSPRRRR